MLPLADTHVHLLAGLDDGPRTLDESLAMARMLVAEGCRSATALAHQNPMWPENTAEYLLNAASLFKAELVRNSIPLDVSPTGEVMLTPSFLEDFDRGRLLTYGNFRQHVLVEMPHDLFLDIRPLCADVKEKGVRLVLAHAERYPELLYDPKLTTSLIQAGCLIQVTANALADPMSASEESALKQWAKNGCIHVLGSDGHRIDAREPRMADGFNRLVKWVGQPAAERIGCIWSNAILQGNRIEPPPPVEVSRNWFGKLFS